MKSKDIVMPESVGERYKEYCKKIGANYTESLRVMVLESIAMLHNTENLSEIIDKTRAVKKRNEGKNIKFWVKLPQETLDEINTYVKFFRLTGCRNHFMYYIIEKKLLQKMKDVLEDE